MKLEKVENTSSTLLVRFVRLIIKGEQCERSTEITIGEITIGEITIGEITIGETTIGEITIEESTIGEITIGEITFLTVLIVV